MVRSISRTSSAEFVVLDEASGPVVGLHDEVFAGLDPFDDRDVRMPAVVDQLVLVGRFLEVNLHDRLGHVSSFSATWRTSSRNSAMQGSHREEAGDRRLVDLVAGVGMHDAAAFHDQDAVGDVEHEAQHLLADHDADVADACGFRAGAAPGP